MKKSTKIRLVSLILVGILLGFLSEMFLTIFSQWTTKMITSSTINVFFSLLGLSICCVIFVFSYLGIVKNDEKWPIRAYFTTFILYDVMIVFGGELCRLFILTFTQS
ncbi:hypothetical protein AKUG0406_14780 [Apilactobacillus kunkeei]|uniref:Uncharacterized protein n=2 Tax=Apilactobacillus kunkeei TaxID=148814 RepID=A0AAC8WBH3_9LACO|nr:hypothetical protein [Apilactobacillus kunkeei]ALJ31249.1 hypothetical protein APS55_02945 [Apilactobacillus kunkeei]KDB01145.1 hypothetical protein LAKU_6c00030 [Apilactobacillus kunkeei EFB6]KFJ14768.1 hypothetical protein JI66_06400 [Apilactobacillus kunkeei]KOY70856.1 hypothetical protein RZ55_04290 [Apilactobacillus kunkeei]KOY71876.1 hypothetical protein RZ54_04850 [Apilactobacillus kunkeei]